MGSWQRSIVDALTSDGECIDPINALRGRARHYAPHYRRSLANALRRSGIDVRAEYRGPHGRKYLVRV